MDWMGAENFHSITGDTRHRSLLHKVLSTVFHAHGLATRLLGFEVLRLDKGATFSSWFVFSG